MSSPLFEAIRRGDAQAVRRALEPGASPVAAGENGVTPVLFALYHGHPELARLIARATAPSFVELCALGELEQVCTMLRDSPMMVDARSADGFPALGLAIFFGQPDVAALLIESGADVRAVAGNAQRVAPVHAAAAVRDTRSMRLLLERGADPNARQQLDFTPLHAAASRGDIEMAQLLLAHGADRHARNSEGLSAEDVAQRRGHPEFAQWLRSQPD